MSEILEVLVQLNFFLTGMFAFLAILALASLWDAISDQIKPSFSTGERVVFCPQCQISLLSRRFETIIRCPRCGSLCSLRRER